MKLFAVPFFGKRRQVEPRVLLVSPEYRDKAHLLLRETTDVDVVFATNVSGSTITVLSRKG